MIARTFLAFSVHRMERTEHDIDRCLVRLTDEQMLARGGDHENSIANLLLHLSGNLRQWILFGIAGQPDVRTRDAEFALDPDLSVAAIRQHFSATLAECRTVIAGVSEERLLEVIDPQPGTYWGSPTVLEGIYQVVGHLQQHAGQIILLTKQLTRSDLDLTLPRKR
jgi:uncharacterized damage-inducible protein DinB